jgi:hypothetical protein
VTAITAVISANATADGINNGGDIFIILRQI